MKKKYLLATLSILLVITLLQATAVVALAVVGLIEFSAFSVGAHLRIHWETASEIDNSGFYINRGIDNNDIVRVSDFIPSKSDGIGGAIYDWDDNTVAQGVLYYYKLEAISSQGSSTFSSVISATLASPTPTPTPTATFAPGVTPSATATPTASLTSTKTTPGVDTPTPTPSPTATRTATATGDTQTPTATRTPTIPPAPTKTRTPTPFRVVSFTPKPTFTRTVTATFPPTAVSSATASPTTTLAPLPAITLQFPLLKPTGSSTPTSTNTLTPIPSKTPVPSVMQEGPSRIGFLIGAVALLWLFLGGFLFFFIRRLRSGDS